LIYLNVYTKFYVTRQLKSATCSKFVLCHTSPVCASWLWPDGISQCNCRKLCLSHAYRRDNYTIIMKQ